MPTKEQLNFQPTSLVVFEKKALQEKQNSNMQAKVAGNSFQYFSRLRV